LFLYILIYYIPGIKTGFSTSFLQSSVSHDPSEIIQEMYNVTIDLYFK